MALEEPRAIGVQPDIFDTEELREGGGVGDTVGAEEDSSGGVQKTAGPDPAAAKGDGKKRNARGCVGSSFTFASVSQTCDDAMKLASAARKLWRRVLIAIDKCRSNGGASDVLSPPGGDSLKSLEEEVRKAAECAEGCLKTAESSRADLEKACAVHFEVI